MSGYSLQEKDLDVIPDQDVIEEMVEDFSYSENIKDLLGNPELGEEVISDKLFSPLSENYLPVKSNCFGTVIHVLNSEKFIENPMSKISLNLELRDVDEDKRRISFPDDYQRPGYIDSEVMKSFLEESNRVKQVKKEELDQGIVAFCRDKRDREVNLGFNLFKDAISYFMSEAKEKMLDMVPLGYDYSNLTEIEDKKLVHSGIYLGKNNGHELIFNQLDVGCRYEVSSLRQKAIYFQTDELCFYQVE